jgi:hypothetical protein
MMLPSTGPVLSAFPGAESPWVWLLGSRVTKRVCIGPRGDEILSVCAYREEMGERVAPGSNSF